MFNYKNFLKSHPIKYSEVLQCPQCGKCRIQVYYIESFKHIDTPDLINFKNAFGENSVIYYYKDGVFKDVLILIGGLTQHSLNHLIISELKNCAKIRLVNSLKINVLNKIFVETLIYRLKDLIFIKSYDIIFNEIKLNVNLKPEFYIKNNDNFESVELKEIPKNISNQNCIKEIRLTIDENLKITDLKIKGFHPNADVNGSFCLGNYRFSDLNLNNFMSIYNLLLIYNLNNRHFDVEGLI